MSDRPLPPPGAGPTVDSTGPEAAPEEDGDSTSAPETPATLSGGPISRNVVSELFATTVVMLCGPGLIVLGGADGLAAALGFGIGTAIAIGVLGAVANPAFTLALLLVREITPREAASDWIGQVAGGVIGGLVIFGIDDLTRSPVGSNGWGRSGFSELGSVMSAELAFGVLIVVVLLASISQRLSQASIAAFTGAAVTAAHLVLIPTDGGGVNPARSIGSALFADTDPSAVRQLWVFVLVPMVAAVAAVFVWLAIDDADVDDTLFDDTVVDDAQNVLTGDDD